MKGLRTLVIAPLSNMNSHASTEVGNIYLGFGNNSSARKHEGYVRIKFRSVQIPNKNNKPACPVEPRRRDTWIPFSCSVLE